jgi:hypothetical protein
MIQQRTIPPEQFWKKLCQAESLPLLRTPELQALETEDAVCLLHQAIAPHPDQLQPPMRWISSIGAIGLLINLVRFVPSVLQIILMGIFILTFLAILIAFLPESHKRRERTERLLKALGELAPECRSARVLPELLDLLCWVSHAPDSPDKRSLQIAVARRLSRVSENELSEMLTPPRRQFLRTLCLHPTTEPSFTQAALLALASVRDEKTLPIAQKLTRVASVRDAAEAFLDTVR